jgi:hypothetical protein
VDQTQVQLEEQVELTLVAVEVLDLTVVDLKMVVLVDQEL